MQHMSACRMRMRKREESYLGIGLLGALERADELVNGTARGALIARSILSLDLELRAENKGGEIQMCKEGRNEEK